MKAIFFESDFETESFMKSHLRSENLIFSPFPLGVEKRTKEWQDVEGISVHVGSKCSEKTLREFKNLKWIATRSTGLDHIDLAYCKKKKIQVMSVPHYGTQTVAEFTFTLLLALIRKLAEGREMLDELRINQPFLCGQDLCGKTIGLIGLGDIGTQVAKIAHGFGMKVLGFDPFIQNKKGVEKVSFKTLIQKSDVISLHCPATCGTKDLLNAGAFEQMKKGVIILNTARGQIIHTPALYDAILNKIVSGAALDVAEEEAFLFNLPYLKEIDKLSKEELKTAFINQKLLQMECVMVTPHMAFNTREAKQRILEKTLENLKTFERFQKKSKISLRQGRK